MQKPGVVVVGAGIAGVACARQLADAGIDVRVLDRGRRIGGRMAVRTVRDHAIDLGASYFTVEDDRFATVVDDWRARGLARVWTDGFCSYDSDEGLTGPSAGSDRWSATHGLRFLVEDLATGLDVESRTVGSIGPDLSVDGRAGATHVLLAMPDPQAVRLLGDGHDDVRRVLVNQWDPSLALAAGWRSRTWTDLDGVFVNDPDSHPAVRWIADDGRRRGDGAPVLVAHAAPDFARLHLDDPDAAAPQLLAEVRDVLGIDDPPDWSMVQRWTFSQPASPRSATYFLSESGLGVCGDGWSERSRVEAAYLSGVDLADAIVARPGA